MPVIGTSGSTSGDGKRRVAAWPKRPRPYSTLPKQTSRDACYFVRRELVPVLAPLAAATQGGTYNVNADTFAGAIAGALKAKRLLLLTDVPSVLDKSNKLIKQLSPDDARELIADGTISGAMIPKVETCIYALEAGVEGVVILDGKVPHAVLLELLTDHGAGTLMMR
jgi:acetylglutamate kinase